MACWCAMRMTSWCSAGAGRKRSGRWPCCVTVLGELGLELKAEKTRIVHLREGGEGAGVPRLRASLGTCEAQQEYPVPRTLALTASDAAGAGTASVKSRRGCVCC